MGWDETNKPLGMSTKAFFQAEFKDHLVDLKVIKNVAYAAYKGKEGVLCLVILIKRKQAPYFNFAYKIMDETLEPYYYDCPDSILKQLTPPINDHAKNWRSMQHKAKSGCQSVFCEKSVSPENILGVI